MITFGVVLLILGIGFLALAIIADAQDWDCGAGWIGYFAGAFLALAVTLFVVSADNEPTAMDVYQGKTTLQYTIVDSVKVDSVVVWKMKED